LDKYIHMNLGINKQYTWIYKEIYRILLEQWFTDNDHKLLLNLLNEYSNITDSLVFTDDVRTEWRKLYRLSHGKWYKWVLYLPTFNSIDCILKKMN
jgi:hypothetical protein